MIVAIDAETTLLRDLGKVPTEHDVPDLCVVTFANDEGNSGLRESTDETLGTFLRCLLEADDIIVFHNASFDIGVLCKAFPEHVELWKQAIRDRRIRDTCQMFSFRCITPNRQLSLQYAAWKTLGVWIEKGDVRTSFQPGEPLTEEQRRYAIQDAEVTLQLYESLVRTPAGALTEFDPQHVTPKVIEPHRFIELGSASDSVNQLDQIYSAASAWQAFTLKATGIGVDLDTCRELADVAAEQMCNVEELLLEAGLASRVRDPKAPVTSIRLEDEASHIQRRWHWWEEGQKFRRLTPKSSDCRLIQVQDARVKMNMAALREAYVEAAEELELHDVPRSDKTGEISLDYKYWNQFRRELPEKCGHHMAYQKAAKLMGTYFRPLLEKAALPSTPVGLPSSSSTECETCDPQCEPSAPCNGDSATTPPTGATCSSSISTPGRFGLTSSERLVVYGSYGIGFAETGRWTSWRPNLQNQPKSLRRMYTSPTPTWLLVSADYKSLEMYTLAQTLESFGLRGTLYETLKSGGDVHTIAASLIHGVPEEEVTPKMRQGAKACNFGLPGGMGVRRFWNMGKQQYGLTWTFSEAAAMKEAWLDAFPEVREFLSMFDISPSLEFRPMGMHYRDWLAEVGLEPTETYTRWDLSRYLNDGRLYNVTIPSGRRFPNRRYSQAANVYFQAPGAEVVTRAFVKLADAGQDVVAVVHDSITCQAPGPYAQDTAHELAACMLEAQKEVCPDLADFLPRPDVEISERWA